MGVAAALRHRQSAAAAAAVATCWRCWPTSSAAPQVQEAIGGHGGARSIVAFVIAVPLGAAIGVLVGRERLFRADLQADAVLRVQHAEIDLPADVHPRVRHRLRTEGGLRGVLHRLRRHHERGGGGRVGQGRPRAGGALLRRHAHADPHARLRAEHDADPARDACASR